ncbi:hypothetical protein IS481_18115 [Caldimonas thermodepolymerans]|uniref:Phospholipid N-methyltransferase n=2 Tax=Caldimonas thermodepolymerans TaxID=215580 RepID=A0A2S5T1T6_9BURK|nr:hypothetical protein C1702_15175 [Caldimonas thermodepolymerans]QPC33519.1 hypothetical protein IS481_18115 [Caldimonas thermodepolymerans]RDH95375.1 phospholipid N-methyltransferase [Caldimonas thermodepolymerans]TCP03153.1 phospholipid N-methyltransferase [Caldimonas thermodepolymerans]
MLAVARPMVVGAILPSSRRLAQAMADGAQGAQAIVELGAGTGAITQALRARYPEVPTTVVELQPALARLLRRRFPGATIVEQPAHEVLQQIDPGDDAVALVSSLPFRSLPAPWREAAREAIETFLVAHPRCRLVQYTYQPRVPFELVHADRLAWRRRTWVWRNAPPAWVWELEAAAPAAA